MRRTIVTTLQLAVFAIAGPAGAQAPPPAAPEAAPAEAPAPAPVPDEPAAQPAEAAPVAAAAPGAPAAAEVLYTTPAVPPAFQMLTAGKMAFGALGAIAAIAASKQLMIDNALTDPAEVFRADLAKAYAGQQGLSVGAEPVAVGPGSAKAAWAAAQAEAKAKGARYLVDSGTQYWMAIYFPVDWAHYAISYGAAVQVVDLSTGKVVSKGRCVIKPTKTQESPTYDALMANKAALLKKMSADAAQQCAAILKTDALKLPAGGAATP